MTTNTSELTEDELNERHDLGRAFDMRIDEQTNGSYANLKNAVFVALVLGMGVVEWVQQTTNAEFSRQIAILQLECRNNAQQRTYEGGR